jgi:hypothetical protein
VEALLCAVAYGSFWRLFNRVTLQITANEGNTMRIALMPTTSAGSDTAARADQVIGRIAEILRDRYPERAFIYNGVRQQ